MDTEGWLARHIVRPVAPELSLIERRCALLHQSQWWRRSEIEEYQLTQFRKLFEHAKEHVPLYQGTLAATKAPDTFAEIRSVPILQRSDFKDDLDSIESVKLPVGSQRITHATTSGSTGVYIRVATTTHTELMRLACMTREFEWYDMDPSRSFTLYRDTARTFEDSPIKTLPAWPFGSIGNLVKTGSGYWIAATAKVEEVAAHFSRKRPEYVQSMPGLMTRLLDHMGTSPPQCELLQFMGEVLDDEVRARIASATGATIRNLYASVETGRIASECPLGGCLHVHEENVLLEVIREDGSAAAPGETGLAVVTPLHSYATPLIRYELGDGIELSPEPCPCGRSLLSIRSVAGRVREKLRRRDGGYAPAYSVFGRISKIPGISEYCLVQRRPDEFLLEFTGGSPVDSDLDGLKAVLGELTGGSVEITLRRVPGFEVGPTGKKIRFRDLTSSE